MGSSLSKLATARVAVGVLATLPFAAMPFVEAKFACLSMPLILMLCGLLARPAASLTLFYVCVVGFIVWPPFMLISFPGAPDGALLMFGLISSLFLVGLVVLTAKISREHYLSLTATVRDMAGVFRWQTWETRESLKKKGVPLVATRAERHTDAGTEHIIRWVDFALLRRHDRDNWSLFLPLLCGVALFYAFATQYMPDGPATALYIVAGALAAATIAYWLSGKRHERPRYAARSVVFRPDGSILIETPPALDPNTETDGSTILIQDGLRRLTAVEYGRTAEWHTMEREHVYDPNAWFDVHILLGVDHRIAVSRNFGSRQHAHQVAGALNTLRVELTSLRPRRPQADRVID